MASRKNNSGAGAARKQEFKTEYTKRWDFIKPSKIDKYHARCTLCESDFSVAHGGANDITGQRGQ